jgi:hypothetical protein
MSELPTCLVTTCENGFRLSKEKVVPSEMPPKYHNRGKGIFEGGTKNRESWKEGSHFWREFAGIVGEETNKHEAYVKSKLHFMMMEMGLSVSHKLRSKM